MSADLETLAEYFRGDKFKSVRATLMAQAAKARALGAPEHFPTPVAPKVTSIETVPIIDLRLQTYEILSKLREPTPEEKETLENRGQVFLPIESKTFAQVGAGYPDHFWDDELYFAHYNKALREYAMPVAAEVGFNLNELVAPGSFSKSQNAQLAMAEARSRVLQTEFPDARVIMLPVTAYAQADCAYGERNDGKVLFKNFFARGLDMLSEANTAYVGRLDPSERFGVHGWGAQEGFGSLGLVPAVVFVNNQVAS